MARGRAELVFKDAPLQNKLAQLGPKLGAYVGAVFEYNAAQAVEHMKTNAPWTDRTGNARSGLSADTVIVPLKSYALRLFHRVSYGIWLEVRWAGRYSIILPTVQHQGPILMRMLRGLFKRLA
jgi:hypothetical protein